MKFFIFFTLAFATATPKDLYSPLIEDPALENEGRITNGHKAEPAQFKYVVGLEVIEESLLFWCGGSLINEKWVLTAAHCTNEATSIKVFLGATQRECPEKTYNVPKKDLFTFPLWDASIKRNDIALIQIPETNETDRIGIVKIPKNNEDKYLNKIVVVAGWGLTSDNETVQPDDLHYAILKVSPGEICFERYALSFSDENRICVATPDKVSTCKGDSGGPLVLEEENIQIGVNSYGGHGCTKKEPVVFTRVSAYRIWIWAHTGIE